MSRRIDGVASKLDGVDSVEQLFVENPRLEPCEMLAKTPMSPMTQGVAGGVAVDLEIGRRYGTDPLCRLISRMSACLVRAQKGQSREASHAQRDFRAQPPESGVEHLLLRGALADTIGSAILSGIRISTALLDEVASLIMRSQPGNRERSRHPVNAPGCSDA
jgi:hypothetical protein